MIIHNDAVEYEELSEKSRRKILAHQGGMMMVEVVFDKGGVGEAHWHPHEQISYIAKGKFAFNIEGEKSVVCKGDSIYIPSNALHGTVALEDSVIIDVFTPQREDFLK